MGALIEISIKKNDREPDATMAFLFKKKIMTGGSVVSVGEDNFYYKVRVYIMSGMNPCSYLCKEILEKRKSVHYAKIIS